MEPQSFANIIPSDTSSARHPLSPTTGEREGEEPFNTENPPDIGTLLKGLPACRRCRSKKRRCDVQVPSCSNCLKAQAECIFYDHVAGEDVPRSYIASLVDRLFQLRNSSGFTRSESGVNVSSFDTASPPYESTVEANTSPSTTDPPTSSRGDHRDSFTPATYRYIGRFSCIADGLILQEGLHAAQSASSESVPNEALQCLEDLPINETIRPEMHQLLIQTYLTTVHQLYPFVDFSRPFLSSGDVFSQPTSPRESFLLQMIYSIAFHCLSKSNDRFLSLANGCHHQAGIYISEATEDLSVATLESVTLLALHSLFDPKKGNFGQLIGFAARVCIELGGPDPTSVEPRMRTFYKCIYCMETHFAITMDRPSFLPEPASPIDFSVRDPLDLLTSMCRVQTRARGKRSTSEWHIPFRNMDALEREVRLQSESSPNLLSTFLETQLLLGPSASRKAAALIKSYMDARSIHTFLTPQWIYRAGIILVRDLYSSMSPDPSLLEAFGECLVMLDRASRIWTGPSALSDSLKAFAKKQSEKRDGIHRSI